MESSRKRQHYPYVLTSASEIPGGGDPKSWLEYYKLSPGAGETYVPHPHPGVRSASEGDILWFIFDEELLGYVPILHVKEDNINGRFEIWYAAEKFVRLEGPSRALSKDSITTPLSPEQGEWWIVDHAT